MKTSAFVFGAAVLAAGTSFGALRAVSHDQWGGKPDSWQMKRHAEKMAVVANGGAKVVFIGDSITHFWESLGKAQMQKYFSQGDWKMLDLGTSADRTEHVLWRLNEGRELDGYEAKCVLLMIGTNNSGHFPFAKEPPSDAILGIREIVRTIRAKQPKAKIVLTAIFPCGEGPANVNRRRNDVVNREIARFADGVNVFWCDFGARLVDAKGDTKWVMPDRLHPGPQGYEIWYESVKPFIEYALSDGSKPAPKHLFNGVPTPAAENPATVRPATRVRSGDVTKGDWWLDRLLRNRRQIADSNGKIDLVFFGDSITHNWEGPGKASLDALRKTYTVLNIGYGGDQTQHLVWRGENGELDGYEAKCVMLMIGTNNSRSDIPEHVALGVRRILNVIAAKQPNAKTLLLPIFPRGASANDALRKNNEKVNAIIKSYADGKKVIWVDFNAKFLDANGDTKWIMPDRLHPNAKGYSDIWMPAVLPHFREICGK